MIRVNLLRVLPERRTYGADDERSHGPIGAVVVATTCAVLFGAWFHLRHEAATLSARLQVFDAQAASLQADAERAAALGLRRSELAAVVAAASERQRRAVAAVDLLEAVSHSVPDGLWLLDLRQKTELVEIEGRAKTIAAVSQFAENLETADAFASPVDIHSTTAEFSERVPSFRFRMTRTAR